MLTLKEAVAKLDSLLDAGITVTMLYSEEGTSVKTDFSPTAIRAAVCDAMLAVHFRAVREMHGLESESTEAAILAAFQQAAGE